MEKLKIAVLISGRGSNLQSLIEACQSPGYPAEIAMVISNVPETEGVERAIRANLTTHVIEHKNFANRSEFDQELTNEMINAGVDLICLAGFMRILSEDFVRHWWNKIVNVHPSLLPAFKGLDVAHRVLSSGVKFTGCTIHFVRQGLDAGPIICQAVVPVLDRDDPESLMTRIHEREHKIYPIVVMWIATGRVRIVNDKVEIQDTISPQSMLINPINS